MLTPEQRADWRAKTHGQPGPQASREESVSFQTLDNGNEYVCIYTTRPATVADLIDTERPILTIDLRGDTYQIRLPGTEYRMGGILGALRRHSTMTDEQKQAAGERLRANRDGARA